MPTTTALAVLHIDGTPYALTRDDLDALHAYGRGEHIRDIAQRLGEAQERVGMRLNRLCSMDRGRARQLYRTAVADIARRAA